MSDEEGRKERRAGPFGVSVVKLQRLVCLDGGESQNSRGWSVEWVTQG